MSVITSEDVRNFILDRQASDNMLDMDLSFSPEEIADAMKRAAREANSVPPYSILVHPDALPGDTNVFLYATAAQLYLTKIQNLVRNDVEYTAGGVSASASGPQIKALQGLVEKLGAMWLEQWRPIKLANNLQRLHYYGG